MPREYRLNTNEDINNQSNKLKLKNPNNFIYPKKINPSTTKNEVSDN